MMQLILRIIGDPPPEGAQRTFDTAGGVIGRAQDCDWVLPDPEHHLSRRHCEITFEGGRFILTDTSSNGVFVNGAAEPLGSNNSYEIQDGDRFLLGDYDIEARIEVAGPAAPGDAAEDFPGLDDPFASGNGAVSAPFEPEPPPWDDSFDPARDGDPFGIHRPEEALTPLRPDFPIPPDFDPLAPEADGGDEPWGGPVEQDHVSPLNQAFPAPQLQANPIPEDWDEDISLPPPQDTAAPAAPVELPSAPPPAAAFAAAVPAATPVPPASPDGALEAFLRGAQLEGLDRASVETEALMLTVGQIFREMVDGLREVLQARASLKNEFRVERTVLRAAENNPLKFSADGTEAMLAMLQPRGRGYMPGPRAVQEGFDDIKVHQMAVLAGMQEALTALLAAFDPDALAKRLDKESRLAGYLRGAKSRYWEAYEKRYREIAREAENNFRGILGDAFARAYEDSSRKLRG